jgi:hypothetical protein
MIEKTKITRLPEGGLRAHWDMRSSHRGSIT